MNYKEQSQLVTVLRDKFKEPISDDVIKELFDKKNEIAASDVGTSLEFDDFFVEVIVSWIGTDLTSQKANLLIELINSDNGAVDDSEDALLEELAVCEDLDGLKIDDSFRNKFPDYFEEHSRSWYLPANCYEGGGV